jgi:hypothetical protein
MTVGELSERMTADEFMDWYEHDREYPGESWEQTALICSTVANAFGGKTKPSDFLPKFGIDVEAPSPETVKLKFRSFAEAHNARIAAQQGT